MLIEEVYCYFSSVLGICDDASLVTILEGCQDVAVPSDVDDENYQDFIRRALEELVEVRGTLWQEYDIMLDEIKDKAMGARFDD